MPTLEVPWQGLDGGGDGDAVARTASLSVEKAGRPPIAAGFDVKVERGRASALRSDWSRGTPPTIEGTDAATEPTAKAGEPRSSPRRGGGAGKAVGLSAAFRAGAKAGAIV
jgi:hypothetical protein